VLRPRSRSQKAIAFRHRFFSIGSRRALADIRIDPGAILSLAGEAGFERLRRPLQV